MLLADGTTKPIKDVQVGDQVLATDPDSGKTEGKTVQVLHRNQDTDLTDVTVVVRDGDKNTEAVLHTTWHHPFWDETQRRWVNAQDLKTGDLLHTDTGQIVEVKNISNTVGSADMRDLTVEQLHTYYVIAGTEPVLVHNNNAGCRNDGDGAGNQSDTVEGHAAVRWDGEHSVIDVTVNGRTTSTELVVPARGRTRIDDITGVPNHAGMNMNNLSTTNFALPNGAGAASFQARETGTVGGRWSRQDNSCLTHCALAVQAGGYAPWQGMNEEELTDAMKMALGPGVYKKW